MALPTGVHRRLTGPPPRSHRGLTGVSPAAQGEPDEAVGRVGGPGARGGLAHPRGDVAVEVTDEDEAEVVSPGDDAPDVRGADRALDAGRTERHRDDEQAA